MKGISLKLVAVVLGNERRTIHIEAEPNFEGWMNLISRIPPDHKLLLLTAENSSKDSENI